ncbi:RNA polymerase subunit AC19 [Cladophialophora chaetospira]|uniref:RNA polymerase subunit AC19 n=1 Tax=Cladophialophora chaetospira TaxID=386627 RepID=A0AA38XFQ7_9EURO|nr:RNA polymerase subunit AC19 [Cladophialophora chaetospira]
MSDTPAVPLDEVEQKWEEAEEIWLGGAKKLVVLSGASSHAASFQIEKEDHTLGNALRYFVNKKYGGSSSFISISKTDLLNSPDVEFCGYTIPHPSETKMNIRIQTWEDTKTTATAALRKGLEDMIEACDVISEKFRDSRDDFDAQQS